MINENRCIYRDVNQHNGMQCKNYPVYLNLFCKFHHNIHNPVYFYTRDIIPNSDNCITIKHIILVYNCMYNDNVLLRKSHITALLGNRNRVCRIALLIGMKIKAKYRKGLIIHYIVEKLEWFSNLCSLESTKYNVIKIQRLWRKYMKDLSGINLGKTVNELDIFTFDTIEQLDYPFYLMDDNHVYCFDVLSLSYNIRINGNINPYTNNNIDSNTVDRMYHYMYIKDLYVDDDEYKWQTALNAYTELSIKLDKIGIYTDVNWFMELDYDTMLNILDTYHSYGCTGYYMFSVNFEDVYPYYVYDFCKMCLEMLADETDSYYYGMMLYKAIAENSDVFSINAPEWLI